MHVSVHELPKNKKINSISKQVISVCVYLFKMQNICLYLFVCVGVCLDLQTS